MIGMMMSPTSEVTIAPKAAPMMTPTARSTTLPFIANSRNSFSILACPLRSSGEVSRRLGSLIDSDFIRTGLQFPGLTRFLHANPGSTSLENALVDKAGMHHGVADHLAGRRRHVHQRQAHFFFESPQQFEAMLGSREAGPLEDGIMHRRQAILDLQSGSVITLHNG